MRRAISREQRDALYSELLLDLSGIDDIDMLLSTGRGKAAQEMAGGMREAMRLLDDLGWDRIDPRETYELTMPDDDLERLILRYRERLEADLAWRAQELRRGRPDAEQEAAEWRDDVRCSIDEALDVRSACLAVLEGHRHEEDDRSPRT